MRARAVSPEHLKCFTSVPASIHDHVVAINIDGAMVRSSVRHLAGRYVAEDIGQRKHKQGHQ